MSESLPDVSRIVRLTKEEIRQITDNRPFVRYIEPIEFSPEYLATLDARSRSSHCEQDSDPA